MTDSDVRTFYRVLDGKEPTLDDFKSLGEKGEPLRLPHTPKRLRLWEGVSMFDTQTAAFDLARRREPPRSHVAEVQFPDGEPKLWEKTGKDPAHFSFWAPAQVLLDRVVSVVEAPLSSAPARDG